MALYGWGISLRDARGQTGHIRAYVSADTEAHAIARVNAVKNAVLAVSNGVYSGGNGILALPPFSNALGAAAQFQDAEDKMVLAFQDEDGSIHRIQIPAPLAADFAADLETVSNAGDVATLTGLLS